jgi:amidase
VGDRRVSFWSFTMTEPHESSAQLAMLPAEEIAQQLAKGSLTSVELVDNCLERIASIDAPSTTIALNAVAAISADAREVAIARDAERSRGITRGVLHGVPVLIKDNIEALGLPGVAGSTSLLGRPSRDATLVTRLHDAGAIVLASTNLSEWANIRSPRSTSGYPASGGLVANPWALDRSAGGSSSGSGAALAAGLAPLAVGTETDGSIVRPASVNGVVGLKPTVAPCPRSTWCRSVRAKTVPVRWDEVLVTWRSHEGSSGTSTRRPSQTCWSLLSLTTRFDRFRNVASVRAPLEAS